jgi:hypothetical protein
LEEDPPSGIVDRFGKLAVTDHIAYLKVFVGNQVARRDIRVCHFAGKILTLPLHFQMLLGQTFLSLFSVRRLLLFAGEASLEASKLLLGLSVVSGVLNRLASRVGQVGFESNINTKLFARWDVFDFAFGINAELSIVAICTPDNANPLNLLNGKLLDTLIGIANQFEATYFMTIGEGDMTTTIVKLPTRRFVLDTPVVPLKFGVSFLSWFLVFTILIETGDCKPCTISRCLTSHGIEATSEGVFLGKGFAIGLQVVLGGPWIVHPQAQTLVTDELGSPNSLVNGSKLVLASIQLILVD